MLHVSAMRELMKTIEFAPVQDVVAAIEEMNEQIDLLEKTAKGTVWTALSQLPPLSFDAETP
jgi:hypothetical protein